jgi:hypothetical protein
LEDWLHGANAAQRAELLALAARQGLVYANQVPGLENPPPANGTARKPPHSPALQKITGLLAGNPGELAAFIPETVTFCDEGLDASQREAVRRALFTPDLFLLQGLPGTGRSRVVAEILQQLALRGQRALFLANHPASIDVVLRQIQCRRAVLALRFLEPGESATTLPPDLLGCTLDERRRALQAQTWQAALRERAEAEQKVGRRDTEEGCWRSLHEIAEKIQAARRELERCRECLDTVTSEVEREAVAEDGGGPLDATLTRIKREHVEALAAIKKEIKDHEDKRALLAAELAEVNRARDALRPLAEAKRRGQWWTRAWWRATWRGQVPAAMAELESRQQAVDAQMQALLDVCAQAQEKCRHAEEQFLLDRTELIRKEADQRRHVIAQQQAGCQGQLEHWVAAWRQELLTLETAAHRPTEPTAGGVAAAKDLWDRQRERDREACEFARRWVDYLASSGEQLASRVADWANVLAGTKAALSHDAAFAEAAAGPIDVVILEDAHELTDTDFLQAARLAGRWVLVAETHNPRAPQAVGAAPDGRGFSGSRQAPRAGCFQKLWRQLHGELSPVHYVWCREESRLCCTLRPFASAVRGHLEIEHLADYPEIELRILAVPNSPPALAQVVFPASMSLSEAKVFIYRELEEAAFQGTGGDPWIAEEADGFVLNVAPTTAGDLVCLELEQGLRESVSSATLATSKIEFPREKGWTRAKVDQWLKQYLGLSDSGRTMTLRVAYRMMPALAAPVNDIVFAGAYALPDGDLRLGRLEFVAVPAISKGKTADKRKPHPGANGFAGLPREGAGLELDLAAPRGGDRMPTEMRAQLPRRGFANYLEAQAVIRKLEELVSQGAGDQKPVAVIAMYEGQVTLLRRLAERSDILRQKTGDFDIGPPAAFRQRECATVLVSLTRSHGHRAVSFSDREGDLEIALTRARSRLIFFGDPGTLVKRSHWHGPLDHLDAAAADLEAGRITALLRWLALSL